MISGRYMCRDVQYAQIALILNVITFLFVISGVNRKKFIYNANYQVFST